MTLPLLALQHQYCGFDRENVPRCFCAHLSGSVDPLKISSPRAARSPAIFWRRSALKQAGRQISEPRPVDNAGFSATRCTLIARLGEGYALDPVDRIDLFRARDRHRRRSISSHCRRRRYRLRKSAHKSRGNSPSNSPRWKAPSWALKAGSDCSRASS